MTTDKKAYLGDILTGEEARSIIGTGLWREIDLPEHGGAALVVWRMEEDSDTGISPKQERNARKLVAGFNVCESLHEVDFEFLGLSYEEAQKNAERPAAPNTLTPLQAAKEALAIAESHINDLLQGTQSYASSMKRLDPVRKAILAAKAAQP